MGKIISLVTSRDGNIRSAKVRMPSGHVVARPFNLLERFLFHNSGKTIQA